MANLPKHRRPEVVAAYRDNGTLRSVGAKFDLSHEQVGTILKDEGEPIRSRRYRSVARA